MARFEMEIGNDILKEIENVEKNCHEMLSEMVQAGGEVVYKNVLRNMKNSFKTTRSLEKGLKLTKVYNTKDDAINVKVGFYGYDPDKKSKKYPNGTPIELIAMAREYGTSWKNKDGSRVEHEEKNPFFRKSFKKQEVMDAILKVQKRWLGEDE